MKRTMHSAAPLLAALALLLAAAPATAQRKGGEDIPTGDRQTAEVSGRVPGSPRDRAVNWEFIDLGSGYGAPFVVVVGAGEWHNFGIAETDITTKNFAAATTPLAFDDAFSGAQIQVSWAPSDSDSVALQCYVVVKDGIDPGDGLDYFLDSNPLDAFPGPWLVASSKQATTAYRIGSQAVVATPSRDGSTIYIQGRADPNTASFTIPPGTRGKYLSVIVYNPTTVTIDDVTVRARVSRN